MSYHVYIAREGFTQTPMPVDAWLAAARRCEEVVVEEKSNRLGGTHHSVHLKGDPRAWLDLGPEGLILAQAPSRELVLAMFELADALNAGVYGERLQRYRSIEDWERRTSKYRHARDGRRANYRAARRLRIALWILVVVVAAALGWFAA